MKQKKIPLKKEKEKTTQIHLRSTPYQPRNNYKYRNKGIKTNISNANIIKNTNTYQDCVLPCDLKYFSLFSPLH